MKLFRTWLELARSKESPERRSQARLRVRRAACSGADL